MVGAPDIQVHSLCPQSTVIFVTSLSTVPLPLTTAQVCAGFEGCAEIVTVYAVPLGTALAKAKLPLALTGSVTPVPSCRTNPPFVPASFVTVPPIAKVVGGGGFPPPQPTGSRHPATRVANTTEQAALFVSVLIEGSGSLPAPIQEFHWSRRFYVITCGNCQSS